MVPYIPLYPLEELRLTCDPQVQGQHGVGTWAQKPPYTTYKSPYGPKSVHPFPISPSVTAVVSLFFLATASKKLTPLLLNSYRIGRNFHGISAGRAMKFCITAASFGAVGGIFALQFFSEVPKVRTEIMQRMPIIGEYYEREVPPEDNPF